jgi:hypothetical protein
MATAPTFGRRRNTSPPAPVRTIAQASRPDAQPLAASPEWSLDDPALEDWKRNRKPFAFPWRQVFLMASLCFGVASLILPDTVNDMVDWLLYALAAMSFYAGLRRRRA